MLQRVTPSLIYDTHDRPLAAGIRSVAWRARRLLLTADETEIVLQTTPDRSPEHVRLIGQVLDEGLPIGGASVQLEGPGGRCVKATDAEGQFRVTDLPKGTYHLEVGTPMIILNVSPLAIV